VLQGRGISIRKIAKELGRSTSSISRELNRPNALSFEKKTWTYTEKESSVVLQKNR